MKNIRREEKFERDACVQIYMDETGLSKHDVNRFLVSTFKIQQLDIPEFIWSPTQHGYSMPGQIMLETHNRAMAAGIGYSYRDAEDLYAELVRRGHIPSWRLNTTTCFATTEPGSRIGETLVKLGLVDLQDVHRALGIQMDIAENFKKPRLAAVLLGCCRLSFPDFFQALGIQVGVPFRSINESASEILAASNS